MTNDKLRSCHPSASPDGTYTRPDEQRPARPDGMEDEVLQYLDNLRDSGVTNMFGAGPYLMQQFDCTRKTSHEWLSYWMHSFGKVDR